MLAFVKNNVWHVCQKSSIFVSSDHKTFCQFVAGSSRYLFANFKRASKWTFFRNSFILTTFPYRPDVFNIFDIIVWCTCCPLLAINPVGLSRMSLDSAKCHLSWSSSSDGLDPGFGRLWEVPYPFHFLMMVLTVLQGIFKALEIFLYPSPDVYLYTTLSQTCFGRSLELILLSLCEATLPNRGIMVNSCFYSCHQDNCCDLVV